MSTRKTRSSISSQLSNPPEKENKKSNGIKADIKPKSSKIAGKARALKVYCTCREPDDGSPMIFCSGCQEWYHFRCVELKETDAEDIRLYVCPSCSEQTGRHTVMDWEGPEAVEESKLDAKPSISSCLPKSVSVAPTEESNQRQPEFEEEEEESVDDGSEDEYVVEKVKSKSKRRPLVKLSSDSEAGSDNEGGRKAPKRLRKASATAHKDSKSPKDPSSPGPSNVLKRRQSSAAHNPPPKRTRSESTTGEDAARKYCLSKLEEVFTRIFLRYPHLPNAESQDDDDKPTKKPEELTDEEKEIIEKKAKVFTADLEQCIFELYSEPDKNGKPAAAGKYKERFRMLTFNLSKPDRVVLHMRIASSHITAKELSTMSSTDLANEETKQSIKQAEQEALAHSILKKATLPRAKITHKGIQDIEDVNGAASREREREREQEEEERIERETLARLKVQAQRAQAAANQPAHPESPIVSQTPTWGGPPSLPVHAMHPHETGSADVGGRPPPNPLFAPTSSELITPAVEGELNLADLINIDEDLTQDLAFSVSIPPVASSTVNPSPLSENGATDAAQVLSPQSAPASTTALSPFASRSSQPELTNRPSFDLNALWTPAPKDESEPMPDEEEHPLVAPPDEPSEAKPQSTLDMDIIGEEADDQDFDMFLSRDEEKLSPPPVDTSPEGQRAAFEAIPKVWTGKLGMPLDSTIPQEVPVVARQIGGRTLGGGSLLWNTLFPSDHLRIDGRVPVDKSAEYLTQSRLNATKELIAAAFSPESEASSIAFDTLTKYLIAKERHGLVFPWGHSPKEYHPGKELYLVPLLPSDPIPEFLELLDDLQLPKLRSSSCVVGIWVLTRDRLAPPPAPPQIPSTPSVPIPTQIPTPLSIPTPVASSFQLSQVSPIPIPTLSSATPTTTSTPLQSVPSVTTDTLAAEVASLTPEQVDLMIRTLAAQRGLPVPAGQTQAQAPIPPVSLQPWTNPPPAYPPSNAQHPMSYQHNQRPYERYDQDRSPYPPSRGGYDSYDRGADRGSDRGYRGGRGNVSRGRNRGGYRDDRPRDAGWKGRGGRGGGRGGQASPVRDRGGERWADGSPQRWS